MSLLGMFGYKNEQNNSGNENATDVDPKIENKAKIDDKMNENDLDSNPFTEEFDPTKEIGEETKNIGDPNNLNTNIDAFEAQLDIVQGHDEAEDGKFSSKATYEKEMNISRQKLIEMANNLFGVTDEQSNKIQHSTNRSNNETHSDDDYEDLGFEAETLKRNSTITANRFTGNEKNIIDEYIPHPPSPKVNKSRDNQQSDSNLDDQNEKKLKPDEKFQNEKILSPPKVEPSKRFQSVINLGRSALGFFGRKANTEETKEKTPTNLETLEEKMDGINECQSEGSDDEDQPVHKSNTFEDSIIEKCREKSAPKETDELNKMVESTISEEKRSNTKSDESLEKNLELDFCNTCQEIEKLLEERQLEQMVKIQNFVDKISVQKEAITAKNVELKQLNDLIKEKEDLINEATSADDLDTAEKIQSQITEIEINIKSINEEIEKLEDHHTALENRMRRMKSQFVKELEYITSKLHELAEKQASERQSFLENEEMIITELKTSIEDQEIKIAQSNKENEEKLLESTAKLNSLESNLELECKDFNHKLEKINASIKDKDERIMELEAMLNKIIDQKHILEEQKQLLLDNVKTVNNKHIPGIEKAKDLKERYERKLLVNKENSEGLEQDKESLNSKIVSLEETLSNFDTQIAGLNKLSHEYNLKLQSENEALETEETMAKENDERMQEIRLIEKEIGRFYRDIRMKEQEIDKRNRDLRTNLGKIEEHEKMIEGLEAQKKAQAAAKQFKEAQSTKDLIDMKLKFKTEVEHRNEELKEENTTLCIICKKAEEIIEKNKELLSKLEAKREEKIKERAMMDRRDEFKRNEEDGEDEDA